MFRILKKLSMAVMPLLSAIATPIIATSCSSIEKTNFVTTYDDAFDDAITLGIKHDYNSAGNFTDYISKYVRELVNEIGTKQLDFKFFSKNGGSVDPKKIAITQADVVVLNVTDSSFANQIKNVVNNFVFTGRRDGIQYSYQDEQINFVAPKSNYSGIENLTQIYGDYVDVGVNNNSWTPIESGGKILDNKFFEKDYGYSFKLYELQQDPFAALKLLAKSLDDLSSNKNNFVQKANDAQLMQQKRLQLLNENSVVKAQVNNKTIAFIFGKKASSNSEDIVDNIQPYNPHSYQQFYSKKGDRWLKMLFPSFDNPETNFNGIYFADPDIIAGNDKSFDTFANSSNHGKILDMFSHKFDYIVYMAYDCASFMHTEDEVIKSDLKNFLRITDTSATNSKEISEEQLKQHIFYTTYSDMYMTTWGPIGESITISKFIKWINSNVNKENSIVEDNQNILHQNLNLSALKSWRDLK